MERWVGTTKKRKVKKQPEKKISQSAKKAQGLQSIYVILGVIFVASAFIFFNMR